MKVLRGCVGRVNVGDKHHRVQPLVFVVETFGINVCRLPLGFLVDEGDIRTGEQLRQFRNWHLVGTADVSHSRITAGAADFDHGLVILVERESDGPRKDSFP